MDDYQRNKTINDIVDSNESGLGPLVIALMVVLLFAIVLMAGTMDFNDRNGCNLPDGKRTAQQDEACGFI